MKPKDAFGDLLKEFENLTNEDFEKRIETNKREEERREEEKKLARKNYEKQLEIYLAKEMNLSLIYNIDFIDSETFKSVLVNLAEVCVRRQYELDNMFLLSVMNMALNTKKIEPFYNINEMLNYRRYTTFPKTPSIEEKKSIYEYIRCCLKEKIERDPEMKKNAILIGEVLIDVENIDRTFSGLFDSFKR